MDTHCGNSNRSDVFFENISASGPALMYIHGYGSNGNAWKCRQLAAMFPESMVVAPSFDYNRQLPDEIQQTIRQLALEHNVRLIVGSSFGGYHTLCATAFFEGPVWCINPVRDVLWCINNLILPGLPDDFYTSRKDMASKTLYSPTAMRAAYEDFDQRQFQHLPRRPEQVNFALSTDDKLLGDHTPLLSLFLNAGRVVWRDHAGHGFQCFADIKDEIASTLTAL